MANQGTSEHSRAQASNAAARFLGRTGQPDRQEGQWLRPTPAIAAAVLKNAFRPPANEKKPLIRRCTTINGALT